MVGGWGLGLPPPPEGHVPTLVSGMTLLGDVVVHLSFAHWRYSLRLLVLSRGLLASSSVRPPSDSHTLVFSVRLCCVGLAHVPLDPIIAQIDDYK